MLRIDEIYNHTFFPWLQKHRTGYRLFVCDPFGRSDPDSLIVYGVDSVHEHNYIFFFDQEPIHLNYHMATFDTVHTNNADLPKTQSLLGSICTSERDSDNVNMLCEKFGWKQYYYFFHGWAALDWYRGYDKTYLIEPWHQRSINKTFIAPNRIIAGERQHRLEVLYHIFKRNMTNNYISCPTMCPAENITIEQAIVPLISKYSDIQSVFASQTLPMNFQGETDHPMHSCWLSLFKECADSLLYLVTETVATGRRHHLTEKTFKPIAMGMPFVLVGTRGSLEYLRSYGFQTFGHLWDESYDQEHDDLRIQRIADLLHSLDSLSTQAKQDLFHSAQSVIEHNWNHFYNGGFEAILWKELTDMLESIE